MSNNKADLIIALLIMMIVLLALMVLQSFCETLIWLPEIIRYLHTITENSR